MSSFESSTPNSDIAVLLCQIIVAQTTQASRTGQLFATHVQLREGQAQISQQVSNRFANVELKLQVARSVFDSSQK